MQKEKAKAKKTLAELLQQLPMQKICTVGLFLLAGCILSCGKSFFGTWPFGLAAVAAAGGLIQSASLCVGALFGAAGNSGMLILTTAMLFTARTIISMWLVSEKGMFLGQAFTNLFQDPGNTSIHRQRREKTKAGLRYSRSSHRVKNDTAITGVDPVLHNTTLDTGQGAIVRLRTKEGFSVSPAALLGWADRYLFRENILLRMAFGALAALVQGAWAVIAGGYVYYDLLGALFSVMAAPLLVYLFYAATDRHMRTSSLREAGILATRAILTDS